MSKIIGTHYGTLFGHMVGVLCDEFGVEEVENTFTAVMSAIRAVVNDEAVGKRLQAAVEQHHEQVGDAVRAARDKVSS